MGFVLPSCRMANKFYQPGDRRAQVHTLFSGIAGRYDLINDVQSLGLHRCWKRRLARLVACPPGGRALDLCCGTGDVARTLAGRGARIVGLDVSGPMLKVASERLRRVPHAAARQPSPVQLIRGDALRLPFADDSFDAVTISYGLRNLAHVQEGLREMWRVTKPGGRLGVLDFGKPSNPVWRALYIGYLRLGVPVFGKLFCGDAEAYRYILESLHHFPSPQGVAVQLNETGWRNPTIVSLLAGAMGLVCGEKPGRS